MRILIVIFLVFLFSCQKHDILKLYTLKVIYADNSIDTLKIYTSGVPQLTAGHHSRDSCNFYKTHYNLVSINIVTKVHAIDVRAFSVLNIQ